MRRHLPWATTLLLATLAGVAAAGDGGEPGFMPDEFEAYTLVLLRGGDAWTAESTPESDALQADHLAHLEAMWNSGKLVVAGPFDEQDDANLRGLCLYRAPLAEARALAEADPSVVAGRLRVEAMTWWVGKGQLAFPLLPGDRVAGTAENAKGGAIIVADDGRVVYIEGLDSWPDDLHGQAVIATGRLVEMEYLPVAQVSKDGAISQGTAGGTQTVLVGARWERGLAGDSQ
ncbi:MAG: YciI family protein [Myxococcota bacterium]|nr:YciI family protein [Myxococcota bacterium]